MAETRAGLTAKTFLLPQAQPQMAAPQEQPFNDGVQALEGLQYVQGQTSDYYKKVSALKSFMQSVNKNLGIDVRVPDMSRPESIELNQIYQTAIADILAQGNELKQGAGIHNMMINRGDKFTDSSYDKSAARYKFGADYYNNPEKAVTETNDFTSTPSYDDRELQAKQQAYDKLKAEYEAKKDAEPDKAEYWDFNIRSLTPPAPRVYRPNNAETATDRKYTRAVRQAGAWLDKMAHFQYGAHDSFKVSDQYVNNSGTPYLISKEFAGQKIGDRTVVEWRFDPDNEEMMLFERDPATKQVTPRPVSEQDFQVIIRELSQIDTGAIMEAISERGAADKLGQYDAKRFVTPEGQKVKEQNILNAKSKGIEYNLGMMPIEKALKNLKGSDEKEWYKFGDDEAQIGKFNIKKSKGKWIITNIEEHYNPSAKTEKDRQAAIRRKKEWDNLEDLLAFIRANRAHLNTTEQPTTGTPIAPTTTPKSSTGGAY